MLKDRKAFEKKEKDRKRNMVILMLKYLLDNGWVDSFTKLEQESTLSFNQWQVADNVDLGIIFAEYEQYHEIKFGQLPTVVKKRPEDTIVPSDPRHKPPRGSQGQPNRENHRQKFPPVKQNSGKIDGKGGLEITGTETKDGQEAKTPTTQASTKDAKAKAGQGSKRGEISQPNIGLQLGIEGEQLDVGTVLGKEKAKKNKVEEDEEYFQARVLKGIPDFYSGNAELRELAMSLQRDIIIQNPNVRFKDIVGLDDAKRILREAVKLPLIFPHLFTGLVEPWKGALLFGPPGTGKTLLAKAVASECRTIFFNISASSVVSKWHGESEKLIRVLFDLARHHQPSTIFLDEIDSIMSQRAGSGNQHEGSRRLKTELLIQMDGLSRGDDKIFILAASNLPWDLDNALLRRLEKRIYVPLPSKEGREAMIRQFIPPDKGKDLDYSSLASRTEGYSGSDMKSLCKEALMKPLRRLFKTLENPDGSYKDPGDAPVVEPVTGTDFDEALSSTRPSPSMPHETYKSYFDKFGSV